MEANVAVRREHRDWLADQAAAMGVPPQVVLAACIEVARRLDTEGIELVSAVEDECDLRRTRKAHEAVGMIRLPSSMHRVDPSDASVRACRVRMGLSLRECARRALMTPVHLSQIERGKRVPTDYESALLATVLQRGMPKVAR